MMLNRLKNTLPTSTVELALMPVSFSRNSWSRNGVWFGENRNTYPAPVHKPLSVSIQMTSPFVLQACVPVH